MIGMLICSRYIFWLTNLNNFESFISMFEWLKTPKIGRSTHFSKGVKTDIDF